MGNQSGGGFSGNGGRKLDHIGGMIDNAGLSDIDSISECVTDGCDDKESDDAVWDDVAVIDGVLVSTQEHAAKCPLK